MQLDWRQKRADMEERQGLSLLLIHVSLWAGSTTGKSKWINHQIIKSNILIYQTEKGDTKIEVRLENETVWLTQKLMAELFQTTPQNITLHLNNIYSEKELSKEATCKKSSQVQKEGERQVQRARKFYNLDAIISVYVWQGACFRNTGADLSGSANNFKTFWACKNSKRFYRLAGRHGKTCWHKP